MTANEAIKRIKTMHFMCDDFHNCKYGHDCTDGCSEAVKMAVDALQGSMKKKHIGSENMVISSSDLMTILNSDSEELKQYKEVGTVEEFKVLKEKSVAKKPHSISIANDIGNSMVECPICHARSDYDVKSIKRGYCWKCGQKLDWSE